MLLDPQSNNWLYQLWQRLTATRAENLDNLDARISTSVTGAHMLRDMFRLQGEQIGCKHVDTLMKKMSIEAIYRRASSSKHN